MNIASAVARSAPPSAPPSQKIEAKDAPGAERTPDNDAKDKAAAAAAVKAAQANQPVSSVPRAPLSENAGKLVDKLV